VFDAYRTAISVLFQPVNLLVMLGAVVVGLVVGIVPGIGGGTMVALLLPFIFGRPASTALIMLISLHAVVGTSGGITSILLNMPGENSSAATMLDGFPMAQKGEAGRAIGAAVMSSMAGGVIPVVFALAMVPLIMPMLLAFGQPEMAALVLAGILFMSVLTRGSVTRGIISGMLGLLISFVGYHAITGVERFSFGIAQLHDGIDIVPLAIGLFGLSEMFDLVASGQTKITQILTSKYSGVVEGMKDVWRYRWLWLRSTIIGYFVGIIPGIGGQVATWMCYAQAKQTSKHPEKFGCGAVEGVIAPEAADNAKESGALLTTMAFGIPGSGVMTLMLAGFAMVGVTPGPRMMTDHLDLALTLLLGIALANIVGGVICLLTAPYLAKLASVSLDFLFTGVMIVALAGIYVATHSTFNFAVALIFGLIGLAMKKYGYSRPALILGFALGALFENYSLLSIKLYGPWFFFRPIPMVILTITLLLLCYPYLIKTLGKLRQKRTVG
jgi:putative tricarboxylic transport membrane protein